jgi:hypothetical protein
LKIDLSKAEYCVLKISMNSGEIRAHGYSFKFAVKTGIWCKILMGNVWDIGNSGMENGIYIRDS